MVSEYYYRREAERCRTLAAGTNDADAAARWNSIADDYDTLANAMRAQDAKVAAPPPMHVPMQQQPMQQQQGKLGTDDAAER